MRVKHFVGRFRESRWGIVPLTVKSKGDIMHMADANAETSSGCFSLDGQLGTITRKAGDEELHHPETQWREGEDTAVQHGVDARGFIGGGLLDRRGCHDAVRDDV